MKKTIIRQIFAFTLCVLLLAGCGANSVQEKAELQNPSFALEDGVYRVDFDTDNTMFHVNDVYEGKAKLVVESGKAKLNLVMPSKNILNLYPGLAEDAQKDGAELISPSTVTVTYADGMEEEVYAFEVPVSVYDEEFDLALIGKKGVWYDHKVKISNAETWSEPENKSEDETETVEEGVYQVPVTLEGGTGRVSLESPAKVEKKEDGYIVTLVLSSKNYDYMLVDDVKYLPIDNNDRSAFEIPVSDLTKPLHVIADTVAMSTPHEIEYTITFDSDSIQ